MEKKKCIFPESPNVAIKQHIHKYPCVFLHLPAIHVLAPESKEVLLYSPFLLQNNTFGKRLRCLTKVSYLKLKQEHKVSYRCSLPSPLQKGSKDYKILHRSSARFFDFGKKFLRNLRNFLPSVQENSEAQNFQNLLILGSLLQWRWQ